MNTEQNKTGAPAAKVADPLWNPYVAGVALGLVFLVSFLVLGHGLGASGAANRVGILALETVAPEHVRDQSFFSTFVGGEGHILNNWLVFAVLGVFLGGAVSSTLAGRAVNAARARKWCTAPATVPRARWARNNLRVAVTYPPRGGHTCAHVWYAWDRCTMKPWSVARIRRAA